MLKLCSPIVHVSERINSYRCVCDDKNKCCKGKTQFTRIVNTVFAKEFLEMVRVIDPPLLALSLDLVTTHHVSVVSYKVDHLARVLNQV